MTMAYKMETERDRGSDSHRYTLGESPIYDKFQRSVSMLAWGLNEELLIESFLSRAIHLMDATVEDWEIIFVDDCSTDQTGKIADDFARRDPRIRIIHNERNLNVGRSARVAIAAARKEYFFWQTVDWSYDINELRTYLEMTKYFDVVVGVRPYPIRLLTYIPIIRSIFRIRNRSDNIFRALISLTNYYLLRILYGPEFHDFQNVQIYPTQKIQSLKLGGASSFLAPEILFKCFHARMSFIEVPIPFLRRREGEAKGAKWHALLRSVNDIIKNWLRWGYSTRLKCWQEGFTGTGESRIYRLTEPHRLSPEVIRLASSLFRYFRRQ